MEKSHDWSRRRFISVLAASAIYLRLPSTWSTEQNSNNIAANEQAPLHFGRVIHDRSPLFRHFQEQYLEFTPTHNCYLNKGSVQRYTIIDNNMVELVGDPEPNMRVGNGYLPWRSWQGISHVYMKLEDLSEITIHPPLNVVSGTLPEEKVAIIIHGTNPHLILMEKDMVVAKIPVGLGRIEKEYSLTPFGYMQIVSAYTTRHMGEYAGVGFPLFLASIFFKNHGEAFHEAYWHDWNQVNHGWYPSHGCINLPTHSKYDITWNNELVTFGEWFFRWVRTNLQFNPLWDEPVVVPASAWGKADNWYKGTQTMRVISIPDITVLNQYPNGQGQYNWIKEITAYNALVNTEVRLPSRNNNTTTFLDSSARELTCR